MTPKLPSASRVGRLARHLLTSPCAPVVGLTDDGVSKAVIYMNGKFVPDEEAVVSIHDPSFTLGYGCFDTTRTYNGKLIPERVEAHLDRFFQSAKSINLTSPLSKQEWVAVMEETVQRNQHILKDWGGDFWVFIRLTPGTTAKGITTICEPVRIPMAERVKKYTQGITMASVGTRRIPPECIPPRAKVHSYLNNILADLEASAKDPDALALMQDTRGNVSEGSSYNVFLVKNGQLLTPREQYALAGVSRRTIMEMAAKLGVSTEEKDLDMYDVYNADEMFMTSTSYGLCPIKRVNGRTIGEEGEVWGPISAQLRKAYTELVGLDFVAQCVAYAQGQQGAAEPTAGQAMPNQGASSPAAADA